MKAVRVGRIVMAGALAAVCAAGSAGAQGEVDFKKNFGGIGYDRYSSVAAASGGFVAVGSSSAFGAGDWEGVAGKGGTDAIIVKYDNRGEAVWKKHFGGGDDDEYMSVTEVSDGFVAVGRSASASFGTGDWDGVTRRGYRDAIIVKYNNSGEVVWKKNFGCNSFNEYESVAAVPGGVVAAGYSQISCSSGVGDGDWAGVPCRGGVDAIIVKYDSNGNILWKKVFGGSRGDRYNSVIAVSGGIVAAGMSSIAGDGDWEGVAAKGTDDHGGQDAIIVKYDNDGEVVWKHNFGGISSNEFYSVTEVPGGLVAAGTSMAASFNTGDWEGVAAKGGYDAIAVKYDNAGNLVWKKSFGGSDWDLYYSVTAVSGGIIAAGYSASQSFGNGDWDGVAGNGGQDAIAVKYDNDGNIVWKKNFGGRGTDTYSSVTTVSEGVIAAGYSASTSFDNGDWAGIIGRANDDAIIVKYGGESFSTSVFARDRAVPGGAGGGVPAAAPAVTVSGKTLNIRTSSANDMQVRLVDMRGKTVTRFNAAGGNANFSASKISAGRYFVDMKEMKTGKRFTSAVVLR